MKTRRALPQWPAKPVNASGTTQTSPVVMDVLPWPKGYGFTGGHAWWGHILSQTERERLDNLIGLALLDNKVCEQLVTKRDRTLLSTFGLSEETQEWISRITASTLKDLAQAIVTATRSPCAGGPALEAA